MSLDYKLCDSINTTLYNIFMIYVHIIISGFWDMRHECGAALVCIKALKWL